MGGLWPGWSSEAGLSRYEILSQDVKTRDLSPEKVLKNRNKANRALWMKRIKGYHVSKTLVWSDDPSSARVTWSRLQCRNVHSLNEIPTFCTEGCISSTSCILNSIPKLTISFYVILFLIKIH